MANETENNSVRDREWRSELNAAARDSKLPLLFPQDVNKEANARTVIAVLKAFGENATGFAYIEANVSRSTVKPPDILLAVPRQRKWDSLRPEVKLHI